MSALQSVVVPINLAGWPFIAVFAAVTAVLAFIAQPLGWVGACRLVQACWSVRRMGRSR